MVADSPKDADGRGMQPRQSIPQGRQTEEAW